MELSYEDKIDFLVNEASLHFYRQSTKLGICHKNAD